MFLAKFQQLRLTLIGKGTASPSGKHALTMSEASGLSFDIMKPSKEAALFFPSLPDSSWRTLKAAAAASTGFNGSSPFSSSISIGTLPPSESAQALAARAPML